jgi:hypothetical protein
MKRIMMSLIILVAVIMVFGYAYALQGPCVTCHTMHNSQDGQPMNFFVPPATIGSPVPNGLLLRGTCLGCHAQNTGARIVTIGTAGIPQVLHTDTTDLAGGNFTYVATGPTDSKGHNVLNIAPQDVTLLNNPPGYLLDYDPASTDFDTTQRLRCAGRNGCHGNRDQNDEYVAVRGGHHTNDSILKFPTINDTAQGGGPGGSDITKTGLSYRFLYNVHGGEVSDWQNSASDHHNEYKGAIFATRTSQAWTDITTISDLCAECHGKFHASGLDVNNSGIGGPVPGNPWLRHPTDAVIPNTGEYASYTAYSITAPVGRQTIPSAITSSVSPSSDVVTCLSCHGAHATNFADILRWDYTNTLSAGIGCLACHTQKSAY